VHHLNYVEVHRSDKVGWLRAAVMGANDGIVSTASLIVGVAAANASRSEILVAGVAGVVAGAMSMAAGEYVSVSSQADAEKADLLREEAELASNPEHEREELAQIYVARGLNLALAQQVADQLTAFDALKSHARDELGITDSAAAQPIQAAVTSAITFAVGAALPLGVVTLVSFENIIMAVSGATVAFLVTLGAIAAQAGGAKVWKGALRVGFWGAFAMGATALIGKVFETTLN